MKSGYWCEFVLIWIENIFFPKIAIREALEIVFLGISPKSATKIANNKQSKDNPSRRVILADRESEVFV